MDVLVVRGFSKERAFWRKDSRSLLGVVVGFLLSDKFTGKFIIIFVRYVNFYFSNSFYFNFINVILTNLL